MNKSRYIVWVASIVFVALSLGPIAGNAHSAEGQPLERMQYTFLQKASNEIDSLVIRGMLVDIDKVLSSKFKEAKTIKFYDSVTSPEDYFIKMKDILGWNFGGLARKIQEYIINNQNIHIADSVWSIYYSPNFMIYYMPSSGQSDIIPQLAEYLEAEFIEIKALLAINDDNDLRSLFIRSFYPDSTKSYEIPDVPERTNGKIQILLFPNLNEFKRHFPNGDVDSNTGGMCIFSLYQRPEKSVKEILLNVRVAMVFGGYISFPFMTHELAHALHFIYYSDLDSVNEEAIRLYEIYEKQGKDAYYNTFWPAFRNRIPGNNGVFEEAIADYAMFSTGPWHRLNVIPPLKCLIGHRVKANSNIIANGAKAQVEFGLLDLIGSKLRLSRSPGQRVAESIFAWAYFLKFMNKSSSTEQMRLLYGVKTEDISDQFHAIFGRSIKESELEWSAIKAKE